LPQRFGNGILSPTFGWIVVEKESFFFGCVIAHGADQAIEVSSRPGTSFLMAGRDNCNLILCCISMARADNVIRDGWIVGFEEIEGMAHFGKSIFVFGCEFQDTNDHIVCVLK
jgi:hypothetical protein